MPPGRCGGSEEGDLGQLYRMHAMLLRSILVTSLIVALVGPPPLLGSEPGGPAARPASAVQALIERAAARPADRRLRAVEEAGRAAETAGDAAGGLAAATLAESPGQECHRQGG